MAASCLIREVFDLQSKTCPILALNTRCSPSYSRFARRRPPANPHLNVLLWQRALEPERGKWSLPGGQLRHDEDLTSSVRRQLAEKVDLREVAHLEQLAVFSDPHRVPGARIIASTFLGLVPSPATPELPPDTRWHPVDDAAADGVRPRPDGRPTPTPGWSPSCPTPTSDSPWHQRNSRCRRCATSTAPRSGYQVDATNLQRVLARRGVITPTGTTAHPGRSGGRPAALYRFTESRLRVTDEFAALRPPGLSRLDS